MKRWRAKSEERSGIIHPLVATWALDLEPDEVVRLYGCYEDGVSALISGVQGVRLTTYDSGGQITDEEQLIPDLFPSTTDLLGVRTYDGTIHRISPDFRHGSVSLARSTGSRRFLSVASVDSLFVIEYDADGLAMGEQQALFADSLVGLSGPQANVAPTLTLGSAYIVPMLGVDNVIVSSGQNVHVDEDFSNGDPPDWEMSEAP